MQELLIILLVLIVILIVFFRSTKAIEIDGVRYRLNTWKKTAKVLSNDSSGKRVVPDTIFSPHDGNMYTVTDTGPRNKSEATGPKERQYDAGVSVNSKPALSVTDYLKNKNRREERLFATLKAGTSVFKYIPENIGEICYCDSTNPKAEPDTAEVTKKKIIQSVVFPGMVAYTGWLVFPEFTVPITFMMILVMGYCIYKCLHFSGTDYFVGTEGAAEVVFKNSRENIIKKTEIQFRDIEEIVTIVKEERQGKSSHKEYIIDFYGKNLHGYKIVSRDDAKGADGRYIDTAFRYGRTLEKYWSQYKLPTLMDAYNKGTAIRFNIYKRPIDFIEFQDNKLTIDGIVYDKSNIKYIGIKGDKFVIEDIDYSPGLFGLTSVGNKESVPLNSIGNRELFLIFYNEFASKLGFTP